MKFSVVESFTLKTLQGNICLPTGKVLELSQDQADRLGGRICPAGPQEQPFVCQASKTDGRICGSTEYRTGVNGFRSCADTVCQVPVFLHGLVRRGGKR